VHESGVTGLLRIALDPSGPGLQTSGVV